MHHPRSAPIGRTWTRILVVVAKCRLITTEGIAADVYGEERGADGVHRPTRRGMFLAKMACSRMARAGYLRRARPWTPGELWALAEYGLEIFAEIERRPRRKYRTSSLKRLKTKHRRDTLSPRRKGGGRARCINENQRGTHGPPVDGSCRCQPCNETHRRSM